VKADRFWQQLGWRWRLDRAEAAEPIDEVVIWGKSLHKVHIFQEVKDIGRRDKVRFLFGLAGNGELFGDDCRLWSGVL